MSDTYNDKPEAYIEVRSEGEPVHRYHLEGDHALIGRSENCHIPLEDRRVSRLHAELVRDPFGRWWVRDLSSRNGIRVNGEPIREQVLRPGDLFRIWDYYLSFQVASFVPSDGPGAGLSLPVSGVEPDQITTVSDFNPVKVDASHLNKLMDVGDRLMEIQDGRTRLRALCRLMVTKNFHGRVAAALRVHKSRPEDPPEMLCEVQSRYDDAEHMPYISRSVLKTIRENEAGMIASNVTPGGDVVGLSLAADVSPMSAVVCPVRTTPRILDILYVVLPPEYGTSEWLSLAMLAVRLFQQAESAWIARRQSQAQAVISGEIERASRLQRRLLPRPQRLEIPGVDVSIGFEPCRWVGGDYVDVLPTPDGRVFLIVADVSGKGLPAALISSSLHTMVHTGLRAGLGVVRLIDQLNAYLCETLPESSFVTAVAVMLNPATGEVQCVNAGHPPALVVDPDGGHRRLHSAVNLPLGVDLEPMQWQTDQLEPGHLLTLYTDGITETVPDGAKRMLGPDGFAQRLEEIYNYASNATTPLPAGIGEPSGLLGPVLPELDELAQRLSGLLNVLCGSRMAADDRTFLLARRQNTLTSSILD